VGTTRRSASHDGSASVRRFDASQINALRARERRTIRAAVKMADFGAQ
jgi:hypothetical protein